MRPYNFLNILRGRKYALITETAICLILMILISEVLSFLCRPNGIYCQPVWAETERTPDILDGFKDWYGKVTTFKADFHQKTLHPLWGEEQEARGEVWFKKPGLMHWKYLSPQQDIIIVNQEGFFWYVPEDNQLIKREKKEAFRTISPMSILGEDMQLEKDFEITGMEKICRGGDKKEGGERVNLLGYAIFLKPRDPEVAIKRISVEVRAEGFSLAAIEVEETSGNINRIEFEKIVINKDISPDLFQFTPSPDTKVITPEDFPAL